MNIEGTFFMFSGSSPLPVVEHTKQSSLSSTICLTSKSSAARRRTRRCGATRRHSRRIRRASSSAVPVWLPYRISRLGPEDIF